LRAIEISAQALLKGTKVDGIYSADPLTEPAAKRYPAITYTEVIDQQLGVMDATAITFCRENRIPIIVFKLLEPGNMKRVILGEKVGSIVQGEKNG
jgi:uridylate kinase